MGGFDDHGAILGDWMPPSPSPRTFFSSLMGGEDVVVHESISVAGNKDINSSASPLPEGHDLPKNIDQNCPPEASLVGCDDSNSNLLTEPKLGSRGGLMDRIAARAGFNAPRLNTGSMRPADLSKNLDVRSPCLTIPPGLSPTTLLDSPIFVNNSLVQPSPTTGKFSFAPSGINQISVLATDDSNKGKENYTFKEDMPSFVFKPSTESGPVTHFNAASKVADQVAQVPGFLLQSSLGIKIPVEPPKFQTLSKSQAENRGSNLASKPINSPPLDEDAADQRSGGDPNVGGGQAEDGFNWRKYGQKQVKGSEYPRSYYKCTQPNCLVKKKVERSHEGHITEIIYKGAHTHPKPPPNRRLSVSSSNTLDDVHLDSEPSLGENGHPPWSTMQKENLTGGANWSQENVEVSSSAALVQSGPHYESGDGVHGSCTISNDDDEDEDRATHGSASLGYDGEEDELELKRRRIETYSTEMSGATARAIREPRVVVQTTSEVDILDDGYRWRKYGQKVVKGNPNPRSYYKCTNPGCNVRKHVERASHDLKSVITTYEGKHNHDVPAARNNSHVASGTGSSPSMSNHVHRPEPSQLHRSSILQRPAFGLPGRPQMAAGPGHRFGFGLNPSIGMSPAAFGHNPGKLPAMPGHHPYFGQQPPRPMNDVGSGFVLPKAELKLEPVTDFGLISSIDGGSGNGGAVYQQFISRMPLGPQR